MKVLYDHQAFMQRYGGVSRYFVELIHALQELEGFEPCLPNYFTDNQYLTNRRTFIMQRHIPGKTRTVGILNRAISHRALKADCDLFHPTYFNPYFLPRVRMPFVVTVHDMIHQIFGKADVTDDGTRQNTRILCERAARIIAVSNNTKKDLCRYLKVPDEKVTVVHHATNLCYRGEPRYYERPYLLFVGSRSGYKNFLFFLSSISRLLEQANLDLVCAGAEAFCRDEREALRRLRVKQRVWHVAIDSPQRLSSLYHFAHAFCYPSLYEGFGIPLLEAFACECPVIASSAGSLPEVAGEAAEYFWPTDRESIASAVERTLNQARREELIALGKKQLRRYSWQRSAMSTLEVYRAAL